MLNKLFNLIDEAHERAALGLFVSAWLMRVYADFGDWATVAMFALAAITLVGQKRYAGLSIGPGGIVVNNNSNVQADNDDSPLGLELGEE